jgi:hypothetical protein
MIPRRVRDLGALGGTAFSGPNMNGRNKLRDLQRRVLADAFADLVLYRGRVMSGIREA